MMPGNEVWSRTMVPGEDDAPEIAAWTYGRESEAPENPDNSENTLVCVHGITAQHRSFGDIAASLAGEFRVVGIDLRGRGDSEKPPSGYGLAEHGRDVLRVMDYLGIESATLAGHSMGAFVVTQVARTNPERVESLVLLDGGWPRPEEEPSPEIRDAIKAGLDWAFARLDRTFATREDYLDFWFPDQNLTYEDLPPSLADYYLYDLEEVEGGFQPKAIRSAAEEDSESMSTITPTAKEMREVRTPVYLVRADQDFFPASAPLISDEVRDEMLESLDVRGEMLLDGATHYTMMFQPNAMKVAGVIRSSL